MKEIGKGYTWEGLEEKGEGRFIIVFSKIINLNHK